MDVDSIAKSLDGKRSGDGWLCHCPAHEDKRVSLSLNKSSDGKILVFCHTGCSQDAVIAALRDRDLWSGGTDAPKRAQATKKHETTWAPVTPVPGDAPQPPKAHPKYGRPTHVWTYRNASGQALMHVCRFDTKDGKQILPLSYWRNSNGHYRWRWKTLPAPRPLYGLDVLAKFDPKKKIRHW